MKRELIKNIGVAVLGLLTCVSVGGQTNSEIQESFSAGVQAKGNVNTAFQGEVPYPERFLQIEQEGDLLRFECDNGYATIGFYSENIVHFTYGMSYKSRAYGWGIQPSTAMVDAELKGGSHNHLYFSSSAIKIDIDPITASFVLKDSMDRVFLKPLKYLLNPVTVQGEGGYQLSAAFEAPADEHYYGLGQHQSGWMDHRGQVVQLWHDYNSADGEVIAIPFLLTNKNYAIVYDNASRTKVSCGVGGTTTWTSELGEAISYYVIYGETPDEIFRHYGELCGLAPLPPKKALGYIQCKQRYKTQKELLDVATKHNAKEYPIDYMVVDWFHWDKLGDMSLEPKSWPDPSAMTKELKDMDINCMISCWPRFVSESKHFDMLNKNGWLLKEKDGSSMNGTAWDRRGAVIDITNPDASRWYWNTVNDSYVKQGFDSYWLDESEPDIIPHSYYMHEGLGARVYNIYPLYHAKGLYEGQRSEYEHRVFTLTRSAYLGAHQYGTTFWSSDIYPEWDVLKRQIACGVNFCASGMPYWSSDIGGWQPFSPERVAPDIDLLLTAETDIWRMYEDYPEMYVRWFQYGVFCPTFRAHGTRSANEVWSYGEQAEEILVDYLELRYALMPYIYSAAWAATAHNTPIMRGLFLDFMDDDKIVDIKDQYLFGKSIMVAPVVAPGQSKRAVYLPEGCDWYDLWTNKRTAGGKTITAKSPIETIPLYVRAGSILPKANGLKRANEVVEQMDLLVYPGADAEYVHYEDAGEGYDYEEGACATIRMTWDDEAQTLTLHAREGEYEGMPEQLTFNVVLVDSKTESYAESIERGIEVVYVGEKKVINLN